VRRERSLLAVPLRERRHRLCIRLAAQAGDGPVST
jgi:hypothetical protein